MKEWIICEQDCLQCKYGATLECDGICERCDRILHCPCLQVQTEPVKVEVLRAIRKYENGRNKRNIG